MDYQIVSKPRRQCYYVIVILLIFKFLPYCLCIVNRDLVLTPKQGLQLSGKRIFYEESHTNESSFHKNDTSVHATEVRPWERTLKHVTYLTLFTNAANGIITGNFSKVKEYNNFLNSSYIRSPKSIDSRFGDIVLLAEGRLESMSNGSYRFMEGECDYECARESNIVALWHVQKIRHRDTADRKYHYEMKFSVSPITTKALTETIVRGGPNKRTIMEEQKNNVQTFIQTQDDYPQSFEKIIPPNDEDFSKRRYDAARNFRQVNQRSSVQQVTPIPQSTFLRGIYRNPPPPLKPQLQQQPQHHITHAHNIPPHLHQHQIPQTERLNTGEFYQNNYGPKASPKIELFPSLLNMFMGKPQRPLPPPTTYRPPTNQMKFPRPEIYALHQQPIQEFHKFHDFTQPYSPEQYKQTAPTSAPLVTHHYHHHYFMANNSGISLEQVIQHNSAEHKQEQIYHNEVAEEITPQQYVTTKYDEPLTTTVRYQQSPQQNYQNKLNIQTQQPHALPQFQYQNHHQINYQQPNYNQNQYQDYQLMPPAPQKFIFPNTQIEQQHVVHVTSTPPLKKPQYQQQQQHPQQQQQQQQSQPQQYDSYPYTTALEYTTVNIPLLISYPAAINEGERMDVPTPRNKPFLQSEPIGETIRYSEPDPLYANINDNNENINVNQYIPSGDHHKDRNNQEPQLEIPEQDNRHQQQKAQQAETEADSKREHSESIEAQLPAPSNSNQPTKVQLNNVEISKDLNEKEIAHEPEQNTSQSKTTEKIVDEHTTPHSEKSETLNFIATENPRSKIFSLRKKRIGFKASNKTTSSTTAITIKEPLLPATTTENIKLSTTSKPRKYFVSTSSTESPLRTISRYRNSYGRTSTTTTSTTEKPVLKWTLKRKGYIAKSLAIKSTTPAQDKDKDNENETESESDESNDNDGIKTDENNNLKNINFTLISTTTITPETITKASDSLISASSSTTSSSLLLRTSPLTTQTETEIYEVLTQKSVSKSVSLKVGPNGEEIPIIIDDEENEVKNK